MSRYEYEEVSGVIIDRCVPHGFWLDGHEFETIHEYIKANVRTFRETFNDVEMPVPGRPGEGGLGEPPRSKGGNLFSLLDLILLIASGF